MIPSRRRTVRVFLSPSARKICREEKYLNSSGENICVCSPPAHASRQSGLRVNLAAVVWQQNRVIQSFSWVLKEISFSRLLSSPSQPDDDSLTRNVRLSWHVTNRVTMRHYQMMIDQTPHHIRESSSPKMSSSCPDSHKNPPPAGPRVTGLDYTLFVFSWPA